MKLPDAVLQQHIAVLGKTGSGKTYATKAAIVEPLLQHHKRVGIVDPTGAWWGLRSSRNGKGAGFPILVLGGDHGDLPLPALGGAAVARLLSEQGVSLVADTSLLTVGERTRWFIDFASTLSRLNRAPLHLVLDEAHNFAPQGKVPDPDTGKMLHAANRLASEGRSRGIRLVMITQRPQKLHKDALTSADTLIAMRVLAPHDRMAVEDWIKGCGDLAQGKEVLNSLASLQRGEGWAWYPEGGFLKRGKFPPIGTFDSSATPTDGGVLEAPKGAAEIDLTEIKAALAEAVKEAEANDPKLLRRQIAELQKLAIRRPDTIAIDATPDQLAAARRDGMRAGMDHVIAWLRPLVDDLGDSAGRLKAGPPMTATEVSVRQTPHPPTERLARPIPSRHAVEGNGSLGKCERLILTALAQYPQGRSKVQVAVLAGYAKNGGSFNNALGALRSRMLIEGRGENLKITDSGISTLGDYQPLPTGKDLLAHWQGQLGKAERAILGVLDHAHPSAMSKAEVGERAGYEPNGGSFNNALGRLRTLELIAGRGEIRLSDNLA